MVGSLLSGTNKNLINNKSNIDMNRQSNYFRMNRMNLYSVSYVQADEYKRSFRRTEIVYRRPPIDSERITWKDPRKYKQMHRQCLVEMLKKIPVVYSDKDHADNLKKHFKKGLLEGNCIKSSYLGTSYCEELRKFACSSLVNSVKMSDNAEDKNNIFNDDNVENHDEYEPNFDDSDDNIATSYESIQNPNNDENVDNNCDSNNNNDNGGGGGGSSVVKTVDGVIKSMDDDSENNIKSCDEDDNNEDENTESVDDNVEEGDITEREINNDIDISR